MHDALAERAALVGAAVFDGEEAVVGRAEHRDPAKGRRYAARATQGDLGDRADLDTGHRVHSAASAKPTDGERAELVRVLAGDPLGPGIDLRELLAEDEAVEEGAARARHRRAPGGGFRRRRCAWSTCRCVRGSGACSRYICTSATITSSASSSVLTSPSTSVPLMSRPAAPAKWISKPASTQTTPTSLQVASAQFRGQPETAILTLAGVHDPHMNFSMRMPRPVESWVPKRHQSVPTQVFTVRRPLA